METSPRGLRVFSWNVLLDSADDGCIDASMRKYAPAACLDWNNRLGAILMRIQAAVPDVIFLHEANPRMFADIKDHLTGFNGWHASELVGGLDKYNDAQSIEVGLLVRETAVVVLSTRCTRLYSLCGVDSGQPAILHPKHCSAEMEPTSYVVLSAAVTHISEPSAVVVVGGTHLRWEFGDDPAAVSKLLQAEAAANGVWQHAQDASAPSWILAGDFNSPPDSAPYHLLTNGSLPLAHPLHPRTTHPNYSAGGACSGLDR
jgi:endonuclease/exonuclease/phosphatase family metal-dependent hydrolase